MSNAPHPTRNVVMAKALAQHQRTATELLKIGRGKLSRGESSFLHNIREREFLSAGQDRWLRDLNVRLKWELAQ